MYMYRCGQKERGSGAVKEGARRSQYQYRRSTGSRPGVGYPSAVEVEVEGPWDGRVLRKPEAACGLWQLLCEGEGEGVGTQRDR
jgi:hypothetical protein